MASMLCGCGKKFHDQSDRSSVYAVRDEPLTRPPTTTTTSHVTLPASRDPETSVTSLPLPSGQHVERYVSAGGRAVTVSVRRPQHHQHQHYHSGRHRVSDVDGRRRSSSYGSVLDDYLHAAIETHDASISSTHPAKVHILAHLSVMVVEGVFLPLLSPLLSGSWRHYVSGCVWVSVCDCHSTRWC